MTSGPFGGGRSDTLYRIDAAGVIETVKAGFESNEALVFAQGDYGAGMLISDIRGQKILRLLSDGTLTTFANVGSSPFGPAVLAYGPDGRLYATDASGGTVLRISPDGQSSVYATLPLPSERALQIALAKPLVPTMDGLIAGIYTASDGPTGLGSLYFVPVPIPEPDTWLLLLTGAFASGALLRRARRFSWA